MHAAEEGVRREQVRGGAHHEADEGYQPDVYPPSYAGIPALDNEQWRCGENSNPILMVGVCVVCEA